MLPNNTFNCTCVWGWRGRRCQYKVNYCDNVSCENEGICRSLFRNYYCECLSGSYYGRHCENVARRINILEIIAQSFAYIAIIAICTVALFVIIMDILRYGFDIGPKPKEVKLKPKPIKRAPRQVQRFVYVNRPSDIVDLPENRINRN